MKVCLRNNDLLTRGNVFNRIESINRANKSRGAKKTKVSPLSFAVMFALSTFPDSGLATQHEAIKVTDGSTVTVEGSADDPIEFPDFDTISLATVNKNSTINADFIKITTSGDRMTDSLSAQDGGILNIDHMIINNSTNGSLGDFAGAETTVTINNSTMAGNSGFRIDDGATVSLADSSVDVNQGAVHIAGEGSNFEATNTDFILNDSDIQSPLPVIDISENSHVTLKGGSVVAYGHGSRVVDGIRLMGSSPQEMATLTMDGTVVTVGTADNPIKGIAVDINQNAHADITGSTLTTWGAGNGSSAIWLPDDSGSVSVANSTLETHGAGATGIEIYDNGQADIRDSTVKVYGDNTYGLYNNGADSLMSATGVDILTYGVKGVGAASFGGQLEIADSRIATSGKNGYGVYVQNETTQATLDNSTVITSGESADAVVIGNGANIAIADSDLETTGNGAAGLRFFNNTANPDNPTTVSRSTVDAKNGAAINVQSGGLDLMLTDSTVVGESGVLLQVGDSANVSDSTVNLTADQSYLSGDVVINAANSHGTIALQNQSLWKGASESDIDVSIDASSEWQVVDDSSISSLENSGTLRFASTDTASPFSTLTVNGDYVGNNGTIVFNSDLGDDTSPADKMVVTGDTSGNTYVQVVNLHGAGAQTTADGIELIDVGGNSDGTFALQGRAVAGSYEYSLWQGGVTNPDDGDWYLRSQKTPDPTPDPEFRPEPGAYLGNRFVAENMFNHSYYDRQQATWSQPSDNAWPLWMRTVANETKLDAAQGEISDTIDQTLIQLGADLLTFDGPQQRFQAGIMAGYGYGRTESRAADNHYSATGHVNGYDVGLYATWLEQGHAPGGAYIDSWLQYGWYDNDVKGDDLASENYDSTNLSASMEAGYGFTFDSKLMLEPQMQVIVNRYESDDHQEENGTLVRSAEHNGVKTRLGLRIAALQSPLQPWMTMNWWYDDSNNAMDFDAIRVGTDAPRHRAEIKAGLQTEVAKDLQFWGAVGLQSGDHNYSQYGGMVDVKYKW